MNIVAQAKSLLASDREAEAIALVEGSAARDEADALFMLADWRLFGLHGPQDFAATHRCLKRGKALGDIEAARTLAFLTAGGIGCRSDFDLAVAMLEEIAPNDPYSALQLKILPRMLGEDAGQKAQCRILSQDPHVSLVKGLLLAEECKYLMMLGEPELRPGLVVDPATAQGLAAPIRTSFSTSILASREDLVVQRINRRLADVTGTHVSWGEPLNILRYSPVQEYRPHHDAWAENVAEQRILTALVYLNTEYEGGETEFLQLGLSVRGEPGDALIFRNVLEDGRRDDRTLHAGLPVRSGVKWLASRWIRRTPYRLE